MSRTLMKTATYCLMHLVVAVTVAFALTRSWRAALAIGIVEPLVQTVAFALHERLWHSRTAASSAAAPAARASAPCGHAVLARRVLPRRRRMVRA
jgi:uncharacterized membrane protein